MAIFEAKLEANRQNAKRSCGPRSDAGKARSSRNAVTHGLRAENLIMLDEDPQALADRKEAWSASILPRDEVEQSAVDDAVEHAWMRDRARRAQANRLAANIANAGALEAKREADEVLRLGQKLFSDNRGPLAAYPHTDIEKDYNGKRVSHSELVDDPEDPQRLVLHLQATAGGCQWMFEQWIGLGSTLAEGLNWQSADKLKAVRLLGRQPMEAADDRNVLMVFLACQTMEGQPITVIPEIWNELRDHERKPYARRLAGRGIDRLAPQGVAAARQVLIDIVEREKAQIKVKADAHRRRAEVIDALTADSLLFDDSPAGERLRRYELASGRAIWRSLDSLHKHRSATERTGKTVKDSEISNGPLSVVSGPSSVAGGPLPVVTRKVEAAFEPSATNEPTEGCENTTNEPTAGPLSVVSRPLPVASWGVDAVDEANPTNEPTAARENATNEPTEACENVTNEPTGGPLSVVSCPLPVVGCNVDAVDEANAPNEPTDAVENLTNEPTAVWEKVTNEPTVAYENATSEATLVRENATNEPTSGPLSVVSCPLPVASGTAHATFESEITNEPTEARENVTNEPTAAHENATNEPNGGPLSVVGSTGVTVDRCPLPVVRCAVDAVDEANPANEPTAAHENVTNEPTAAHKNATNEPTAVREIVTNEPTIGPLSVVSCSLPVASSTAAVFGSATTNEPTVAHRNATNEPIVARENVTNEPTEVRENATNEPTAAREIVTNEPTAAREIVTNEPQVPLDFEEGFSVQQSEAIQKACEKIRLARAEQLRKLNEEARREAEAAMALRRFRLREQKNKNGKPAGQPKGQATRPGQSSKKKTAALEV